MELKLEPDYPGVSKPVVFSTKREAAGSRSVEGDLEKIEKYVRQGKCAHFVMIDEDGCHVRRIATRLKTYFYFKQRYIVHPTLLCEVGKNVRRKRLEYKASIQRRRQEVLLVQGSFA